MDHTDDVALACLACYNEDVVAVEVVKCYNDWTNPFLSKSLAADDTPQCPQPQRRQTKLLKLVGKLKKAFPTRINTSRDAVPPPTPTTPTAPTTPASAPAFGFSRAFAFLFKRQTRNRAPTSPSDAPELKRATSLPRFAVTCDDSAVETSGERKVREGRTRHVRAQTGNFFFAPDEEPMPRLDEEFVRILEKEAGRIVDAHPVGEAGRASMDATAYSNARPSMDYAGRKSMDSLNTGMPPRKCLSLKAVDADRAFRDAFPSSTSPIPTAVTAVSHVAAPDGSTSATLVRSPTPDPYAAAVAADLADWEDFNEKFHDDTGVASVVPPGFGDEVIKEVEEVVGLGKQRREMTVVTDVKAMLGCGEEPASARTFESEVCEAVGIEADPVPPAVDVVGEVADGKEMVAEDGPAVLEVEEAHVSDMNMSEGHEEHVYIGPVTYVGGFCEEEHVDVGRVTEDPEVIVDDRMEEAVEIEEMKEISLHELPNASPSEAEAWENATPLDNPAIDDITAAVPVSAPKDANRAIVDAVEANIPADATLSPSKHPQGSSAPIYSANFSRLGYEANHCSSFAAPLIIATDNDIVGQASDDTAFFTPGVGFFTPSVFTPADELGEMAVVTDAAVVDIGTDVVSVNGSVGTQETVRPVKLEREGVDEVEIGVSPMTDVHIESEAWYDASPELEDMAKRATSEECGYDVTAANEGVFEDVDLGEPEIAVEESEGGKQAEQVAGVDTPRKEGEKHAEDLAVMSDAQERTPTEHIPLLCDVPEGTPLEYDLLLMDDMPETAVVPIKIAVGKEDMPVPNETATDMTIEVSVVAPTGDDDATLELRGRRIFNGQRLCILLYAASSPPSEKRGGVRKATKKKKKRSGRK
ncbi:hypothetical protein HK101_007319 [Irineochytrium annulatum]|nr:hypothetical protein HK101_007319 [Irineochytrium annulatum]